MGKIDPIVFLLLVVAGGAFLVMRSTPKGLILGPKAMKRETPDERRKRLAKLRNFWSGAADTFADTFGVDDDLEGAGVVGDVSDEDLVFAGTVA